MISSIFSTLFLMLFISWKAFSQGTDSILTPVSFVILPDTIGVTLKIDGEKVDRFTNVMLKPGWRQISIYKDSIHTYERDLIKVIYSEKQTRRYTLHLIPEEERSIWGHSDIMPELIGGLRQLLTQLQYPEKAKAAKIQGRVFVEFIVDTLGEVNEPRIVRGIDPECDAEALRLAKTAKFKSGRWRGRRTAIRYSLPIVFKIDE